MNMDLTVLSLLEYMETEVRNAPSVPFSSKRMVDAGKLLDLIEELRLHIPEEYKRAQRIVAERDEVRKQSEEVARQQVAYAESRAQQIIADARREAEDCIDEHAITREADERAHALLDRAQAEADKIRDEAEQNAREVREGTLDYADEILESAEKCLEEALNRVVRARDEIEQGG